MARPYVEVEGVGRLDVALGMAALDGFELSPPEVRARYVDVPGRSGALDLTEAMGGPFYELRRQTLRFLVEGDPELAKGRALSALHGRRLRYSLSVDPGHAYEGRWSVSRTVERHAQGACVLTCEVACDPYRRRPDVTLRLNPVGGRWYELECGDMPTRPTLECKTPVRVEHGGKTTVVGAGTWRLNDVLLTRGTNRVYLNSWEVHDATWDYVAEDGPHPLAWDEADRLTWDEAEGLRTLDGGTDDGGAGLTWDGAEFLTWDEAEGLTWDGVEWSPSSGVMPTSDTVVYLTYEIGDL